MAVIDSVKLPDNSTYDLTDNYSGYQTETLATPITINGTQETTVEGALGGLNDYGDALADNLAANEESGAKNRSNQTFTTQTIDVVSHTPNADGSLTVTTNGASTTTVVAGAISTSFTVEKGTYLFTFVKDSDEPTTSQYAIIVRDSSNTYVCDSIQTKAQRTVTFAQDTTIHYECYCGANNVVSDVTFYPMIRDARIIDPTYAPYASTNREAMSFRANGKVGAKNLWDIEGWLNKNNQAYTKSGDVFSMTTSADLYNNPFVFSDVNISVTLSATVTHSATVFAVELLDANNNVVSDTGNITAIGCKIRFKNPYIGQTVTLTSPMIRIAEDTDPTYQPYAMTNRQLTEKLPNTPLIQIANAGTSYTIYRNEPYIYSSYCIRNGWVFVNVAVLCNTPQANWSKVCDLPRTNYLTSVDVGAATNHASPFDSIPLLLQNGELFAIGGTANVAYCTSFSYPI